MAGQLPGSFNLDDIPEVAFEDPNDDFMQYLETLDIPGTADGALAEFAGELPGGANAELLRSGGKRSVVRRGSEALQTMSQGDPSQDDTDGNVHDDKLTKMREKNRQAQARFRKRQKQERDDLEGRIHSSRERMQQARNRRRALSATNQQLVKRAGDAAGQLLNARRSVEALESRSMTPSNASAAVRSASFSTADQNSLSALPASVISVYMPVPTPRPIESFTHHFPLSLEAVSAHSPPDNVVARQSRGGGDQNSSELLPALVRSYKADVAATVQRSVADICWVIQTPLHMNNGAVLSFTTTMSSLECCASFLVFYFATTLEGAMMSHELALADGSVHSDISPDISDSNPNDESLLRQLEALATSGMLPHGNDGMPLDSANNKFCSCNVREQFLLPAAVSQVFSRILTQYRNSLPHHTWLNVCLGFAQLMMTVRGIWSKSRQASDGDASASPESFKSRLIAVKFCIIQHAAATLLGTLRSPHSLGMQQWHAQDMPGGGEVPCEARMHTLFGAWSLGMGQIFTDARRLIRRLTVSGPAQLSYCSAEDKNITLFAALRLTNRQKVNLAGMWRQWHASRLSLDEELAAILSSLCKLPSSEDIPASLVLYIAERASGSQTLINSFNAQWSSSDMLRAATHWGSKLLGVSPGATAEADKAFQKLLDVHDRDASLLEDFIAAFTVPGAVLTPRQHAVFCNSCVKSTVALVDLLRLTQTAAMEEKRMMLLRPFVFTNTSVMAVGE